MKDNRMFWYNFATGEYEYIETPEDLSDYVPQIGGRGLYQVYVEQGSKPIDAAKKVLELSAGKEQA
jgi:hypothetical protein